ncbi:hypothetical protein ANCDUO_15362 [Ancylostoma duodenale]|uniref:Uncharacterized protein n=1 Tax=Ancylostoma duodenale TaxID=51022 RepID=A0A0C2GBZ5_9BILA|nr:hypothetical protein ANCDUO_15362 [Ancylostoma duodenale]
MGPVLAQPQKIHHRQSPQGVGELFSFTCFHNFFTTPIPHGVTLCAIAAFSSGTDMSVFSEKSPGVGRKWDSGVLDIGYSSGENSLLDVITDGDTSITNIELMMRKRADAKTSTGKLHDLTAFEEPTHEGFTDVDRDPLTDSMHVNYDALNGNYPEYGKYLNPLKVGRRCLTNS